MVALQQEAKEVSKEKVFANQRYRYTSGTEMLSNYRQFAAHIPKEYVERLNKAAAKRDITVGAFIRQCVLNVLEAEETDPTLALGQDQ